MLSKCLDHATPAQVVFQVLGGHPMEPSYPFFQPRIMGVRILDVVDAGQNPDPLTNEMIPPPSLTASRWVRLVGANLSPIPGKKGRNHHED